MIRVLFICHGISIHALFAEGDDNEVWIFVIIVLFLSTPSSQRATMASGHRWYVAMDFYPRPLRRGRLFFFISVMDLPGFLSTPSSQRATEGFGKPVKKEEISIHALFAEGDLWLYP